MQMCVERKTPYALYKLTWSALKFGLDAALELCTNIELPVTY